MDTVPTNVTDRLFAGGSATESILRGIDWTATRLGDVAHWPVTLRTALRICLTSRHAMIIWWGEDFTVFYNDAYAPTLSARHPGAMGLPGQQVWPEIWDVIGPMLRGVLATGAATWSDDQLLFLARNGYTEETYHSFSYSPIEGDDGTVQGVFTAVTETTERVLAERRARLARDLAGTLVEARTTEEVARYAAAALAHDPYDVPATILYRVEPDGTTLTYLTSVNVALDDLAPWHTLDGSDPAAPWSVAAALATGAPQAVAWEPLTFTGIAGWPPERALVMPISEPGQTTPTLLWIAGISPRRTLDDAYRAVFSVLQGHLATALVAAHAYEAERQRVEALTALDHAKTIFFSNISHEFRTPLTLMLGPIADSLADADEPLPPGQRERLTVVRRNGLRLLKLVNSLLDFSRIEAGRVQARYVPVDLAQLTADLASTFRSLIEHAGMTLSIDCPPLSAPVYVDRDMWEKIVLNLLSNAFKFTLAGEISVRLRADGANVQLSVQDTGTGIPPAELPRLFERFHRVEGARARTQEGSGIGLALVQELVQLHRGAIAVSSQVGAGTTFTVTLPLGTAHLPAEQIDQAALLPTTAVGAEAFVEEAERWLPVAPVDHDLIGPSTSRRNDALVATGARVLVADDNADMRAYVERLLRGQYTVQAVASGAQALTAIRAQPPDLVLSDVMMPDLDGFGLLQAVRADPRTAHIPVILLSARAGEEATVEGLGAGADDYLIKPFSSRELLARVAGHLALARLRQEVRRGKAEIEAIFDAVADGLVVYDQEMHIIRSNTAFQQIMARYFPTTIPATLHERAAAIPLCDEQGRVMAEAEWPQNRIVQGEILAGETAAETWVQTGAAGGVNFSVTGAPLRDATGAISGAVVAHRDVTERRRQERRVQERARQLKTIFEAAADGIVIYDAQGRLVEWNAALASLFEFDQMPAYADLPVTDRPPHILVRDAQDHPFAPADLPFMRAVRGEVLTGTQAVDLKVTVPSGKDIDVNVSAAPLRDDAGHIVGAVAIYRDITERHTLERAARANAENLRAILELLPVGVAVVDAQGKAQIVNRALKAIWGEAVPLAASRADFGLYRAWWPATGRALAPDEWGIVGALTTGAVSLAQELDIAAFDGSRKTILDSAAPLRDETGAIIGAMSVLVDITERKQLERRVQESLAALLALTEEVVAVTPAVAANDEAHHLTDIGARLVTLVRRIFACDMAVMSTLDPATGTMQPLAASGLDPAVADQWWQDVARTPLHAYLAPEHLADIYAGTPITLDLAADPLRNGADYKVQRILMVPLVLGDSVVGLMSIEHRGVPRTYSADDLTLMLAMGRLSALAIERDRLLCAQVAATARETALAEANRRMNEFLGIASHELRTPLTSVIANVQMGERGFKKLLDQTGTIDRAQISRYLQLLTQSNRQLGRLDRLIGDLLDVSRITSGKLELRSERCDLLAIVRDAVASQQAAWPHRAITLTGLPRAPLIVMADPDRIEQVVINLVVNALKYSPADQPVRVRVQRERAQVRVRVQDAGPGLTPAQQAQLFARFARVTEIAQLDGSGVGLGLGLYICKTIIDRHDGAIGVTSQAGAGSTFYFTLPLAESQP